MCLLSWGDYLQRTFSTISAGRPRSFASNCENMLNILLETIASSLPIACSKKGLMPEVLGEDGMYFDHEQPPDITCAFGQLIESPLLRKELAQESYATTKQYSLQSCADETFGLLFAVTQLHKDLLCVAS